MTSARYIFASDETLSSPGAMCLFNGPERRLCLAHAAAGRQLSELADISTRSRHLIQNGPVWGQCSDDGELATKSKSQ